MIKTQYQPFLTRKLFEPPAQLDGQRISLENPVRILAKLGQNGRPDKFAACTHVKIGSLAVELATVLGHQPHADEIAIDEIRKFGVDENAHEIPGRDSLSRLKVG